VWGIWFVLSHTGLVGSVPALCYIGRCRQFGGCLPSPLDRHLWHVDSVLILFLGIADSLSGSHQLSVCYIDVASHLYLPGFDNNDVGLGLILGGLYHFGFGVVHLLLDLSLGCFVHWRSFGGL
jgi:hypothetical protein